MASLPKLVPGDQVRWRRRKGEKWVYAEVVRHEHGLVELVGNSNDGMRRSVQATETDLSWYRDNGNFQVKRLDDKGARAS